MNSNEIKNWIVGYLSEFLEIPAEEIDADMPLDRFGLSSAAAVALIGDLEEVLDADISPALLFEAKNIADFSQAVAEEIQLENA